MVGKRLYIIAGEASGDLHGSNLMEELLGQQADLDIRFWGGDRMREIGGEPAKHIRDLSFMGFWEVITNIRTIAANLKFCRKDILAFKPDALILIDYPGFNLRIAEWAKKQGIKVYFYVSPQVWAWKENRVKKIKASVDEMYVILPFEKEFYKKHDFEVSYLGHPLLDEIEKFKERALTKEEFYKANELDERPIIALLPGSRKQEISVKLPLMLKAGLQFSDYQLIIAGAPSIDESFYAGLLPKIGGVSILYGKTYDLLNQSTAGLITSGTATLETTLLGVPQVVCYKGNPISYRIAKSLIKIKFISLVNLIMDEEVVRELIQKECNVAEMKKELKEILPNGNKRKAISLKYTKLIEVLGAGGASKKIAASILEKL
ncbi:lipid-A-disaccharide synthase [Crocinitomicaceae bacterium]|jgi:lipid-A-disaccharide synthase|nr:lipid-A-disaccharide synthase [Crocinitomicaceae bacterium]